MATAESTALIKLNESDETIAIGEDDIRGRSAKDKDGVDLGKVDDLLIDSGNKVRFLEIASGGFLGVGKERTFIPVDAITRITDEEVFIDQSREVVAGAPVYDPELVKERSYYTGVLGYYGYGPFWEPDYRYPDYPHYR